MLHVTPYEITCFADLTRILTRFCMCTMSHSIARACVWGCNLTSGSRRIDQIWKSLNIDLIFAYATSFIIPLESISLHTHHMKNIKQTASHMYSVNFNAVCVLMQAQSSRSNNSNLAAFSEQFPLILK